MRHWLVLIMALCAAMAPPAAAHEVRPAYLELRQTAADTFDILWKVPARGNLRLGLYVRLPQGCESITDPHGMFSGGAYIARWSIRHPDALVGSTIHIDGLKTTLTDVLVRIERLDGTTQVARLTPSAPSFVVEAAPDRIHVAETYLRFGIEHILSGIDHLLFLACLMFVAGTGRRLLITITGFTLAHSITLALSALELVRVPVAPVEAAIALSIVFLAVEIARGKTHSLTYRYPIAVSTSFGLLHGFGFAAVLHEIGLPQTELPTALLCFNVGVEIGQVVFVFATIAVLYFLQRAVAGASGRSTAVLAMRGRIPVTYLIGIVASYWLIARVDGFWQ